MKKRKQLGSKYSRARMYAEDLRLLQKATRGGKSVYKSLKGEYKRTPKHRKLILEF